jgi:hypothetical protein
MENDQTYYAHFNKDTKRVYSIGNEFSKSFHANSIEISCKQYTDFINGTVYTHSFFVDRKKINGKLTNILVPILGAEETAANNVYTIIGSKPTKATDLTVSWTPNNWTFTLNEKSKKEIEDANDVPLVFFVVDSNNFNILFRTISILNEDLLNGAVSVPTICKEETSITSIKIATRAVFKKYGLEIND